MKAKVSVGISNNHLHLTLETFKKLFNKEELTLKKKLNQIGEFACEETVTIKANIFNIFNRIFYIKEILKIFRKITIIIIYI